jgi:hypothetical protein
MAPFLRGLSAAADPHPKLVFYDASYSRARGRASDQKQYHKRAEAALAVQARFPQSDAPSRTFLRSHATRETPAPAGNPPPNHHSRGASGTHRPRTGLRKIHRRQIGDVVRIPDLSWRYYGTLFFLSRASRTSATIVGMPSTIKSIAIHSISVRPSGRHLAFYRPTIYLQNDGTGSDEKRQDQISAKRRLVAPDTAR